MALINILAKGHVVKWERISPLIQDLNLKEAEVFPIPAGLGFTEDAFGIAVPRNYDNKQAVFKEISAIFSLFTSMDFEIIELYNGEVVTKQNFDSVISSLIGVM